MAYDAIEHLPEDAIAIYDRNFSNYKMIALHLWQEKERKFIIRGKDSMNIIKQFIESAQSSAVVTISPTPAAIRSMRKCGYIITSATSLKVRLVRVELPTCIEVLITNLWEEEGHPADQFKELYGLRWGVETNISLQKNILQLEAFSGLTTHTVLQDFFATVMTANLHAILIKDAQ
ncbi:transposase, partial [Pseudoflavitalea rhizosphaerae]|uniref:transposase n=1 Tax=Pseudoflavitalea rhizosphaerae TaxID=1884793 RepID=UPI0013E0E369